MTIVEYQAAVKAHLISNPIVKSIWAVKEREDKVDGHLRVRLTLTDDSLLEFSEYLVCLPNGTVTVQVYSYQWVDAARNLIRRWDNAHHYPDLPNAPHHIHEGSSNKVFPGKPVDIYQILDIISAEIG